MMITSRQMLVLIWSMMSLCSSAMTQVTSSINPVASSLTKIRAGANTEKAGKKRKRKKKSKTKVENPKHGETSATNADKVVIQEALKEKDAAQAMGDAIRDRTEDWLQDDPLLHSIDSSVTSVGWAMGTSDDGGGVEAAPTSVLAHYFLKSHGGAHALQSLCSLFAVGFSLGALLLPPKIGLSTVLLKRAFLCAMTKHLAGLLAASGMTAQAIPQIGFQKARQWMEHLARDPVSQYVFYSALMIVWLSTTNTDVYKSIPLIGNQISLLLVGPVLIRELVSTALVLSDILLLLQTSAGEGTASALGFRTAESFVNAAMSLVVTPTVWRTSTATQRQAILAKVVAKTSLAMEVMTGALLLLDTLYAICQFTIATSRPSFGSVILRILCARLYWNFLWVRRKKIRRLGQDVRGGTADVPIRILEALYDPRAAMGISKSSSQIPNDSEPQKWKKYVLIGLGLEA
jgi:hypothetical protein